MRYCLLRIVPLTETEVSMLKVRVASFRRAAYRIDREGGHVTVGTLARKLLCTQEYVTAILTSMPWLREELGVVLSTRHSSQLYISGSHELRKKGALVTCVTLAHELHLDRDTVSNFLRRHPEIAEMVNIVPHALENRRRVIEMYRVRTMLLSSPPEYKALPGVYAKKYGINRSCVYKDIKKYPEIERYFHTPKKNRRKVAISIAA